MVTINQLADIVANIAGVRIREEAHLWAEGRARPQFRQHAAARSSKVAANSLAGRRICKNLSVDRESSSNETRTGAPCARGPRLVAADLIFEHLLAADERGFLRAHAFEKSIGAWLPRDI